jgi:hypothetical protein
LQLHTGEFDLCFQWLTGKILNLKDLRVRILAEIAQNGTLPDLSAVMASTIIARFNFGRKVRCHNGAVEIDSVADAGFLGRSLYPASKSPLLAKDARKGAPNFEGSADLLHLLIARKIVSHFVSAGPEDFAESDVATRQEMLSVGSILEFSFVLAWWVLQVSKRFMQRRKALLTRSSYGMPEGIP